MWKVKSWLIITTSCVHRRNLLSFAKLNLKFKLCRPGVERGTERNGWVGGGMVGGGGDVGWFVAEPIEQLAARGSVGIRIKTQNPQTKRFCGYLGSAAPSTQITLTIHLSTGKALILQTDQTAIPMRTLVNQHAPGVHWWLIHHAIQKATVGVGATCVSRGSAPEVALR